MLSPKILKGFIMSTHQNTSTCLLCKEIFQNNYSISHHLRNTHNIKTKEYYDTCIRKVISICLNPTCSTETSFINLVKGYGKYCSHHCMIHDENMKNQKIYKKKQTYTANPSIQQGQSKKCRETLRNNPEIIQKRTQVTRETELNNPSIMEKRKKSRAKTIKENPSIMSDAGKKIAITKRNSFKKLNSPDSGISEYLYIVAHKSKPIIKVGRSINPFKRLVVINNDFGTSEFVQLVEGRHSEVKAAEDFLHSYFNAYCKVQPSGSGKTEWFDKTILDEALSLINQTTLSIVSVP